MKTWKRLPVWLALLAGCGPMSPELDVPSNDGAEGAVSEQARSPLRPCGTRSYLLKDIWRGPTGSDPMELTRGDRLLFFTADDGVRGRELWASTGTGGEGTFRVRDIYPGAGSSSPSDLTRLDDEVFFAADDGTRGRELWKSDGTRDGTRRVRDIRPGPEGSAPRSLLAFQGRLYFAADDGVHGDELWRSDGTTGGTRLLVDLTPGTDSQGRPVSTNPRNLTALGDDLFFFTADEDVSDFIGLWRSDGTPGGTFSLDNGPDDIRELTPVGDDVLFYIGGDEGEDSLRRTDGTRAGTVTLTEESERNLAELTPVGRVVFFRYRTGTELLRSDGTVAGTGLVKDLGSPPRELTAFRGRLFFTAEDTTHGRELWVSDGTPEGTVLFEDLAPGEFGSAPEALTVVGRYLFFSAETPGRGREPWVSDGTPEGTVPLREIAPGPLSSSPRGFIQSGWDVFFTAEDGTRGRELYALPFRPADACDEDLR
jgi:ELWxxDGT repeat protein